MDGNAMRKETSCALGTPLTPPSSWMRETSASLRTDRMAALNRVAWHGGAEGNRMRADDPHRKHKPLGNFEVPNKHSQVKTEGGERSSTQNHLMQGWSLVAGQGGRRARARAEQRTGHPAFSIRAGTPPDLSSAGSWDGIALAHTVRRGGVDNAMPLANMTIARDHTSYH